MLAEIVWDKETLGVVMVFAIPLTVIVGGIWVKLEQSRSENDLKRSMVERGMSVDDIERVIAARSDKVKR